MKALKIILAAVILLGGVLAFNACQAVESPLEDYNWILTSWHDGGTTITLVPDTQISALFGSKNKTLSGNSGCNQYSGTYKLEGLSLIINGNISVTEIFCSDEKNAQELKFLGVLKAASNFKLDRGNLIIYSGKNMLQFKRENGDTKTISQWGE